VATSNVGQSGMVMFSASATNNLPLTLNVCQTNPTTGACMGSPAPSVQVMVEANTTPTFAVFADAGGNAIPFDPTNNRINFTGIDNQGRKVSGTSVAVTTSPP
jgi:hypothetical protein